MYTTELQAREQELRTARSDERKAEGQRASAAQEAKDVTAQLALEKTRLEQALARAEGYHRELLEQTDARVALERELAALRAKLAEAEERLAFLGGAADSVSKLKARADNAEASAQRSAKSKRALEKSPSKSPKP